MDSLAHDAIHAALNCDWERAIELNTQILKSDENDLSARLRLANALFESGKIPEAKKQAKNVLSLDPQNSMAKKCFEKCNTTGLTPQANTTRTNLRAFLETPGKTNLVKLIHLGEPKILARLHSGEELKVSITAHKVVIESNAGAHVGRIPDDVALRMVTNKKAQFWAAVKSATPSEVSVLLHEN